MAEMAVEEEEAVVGAHEEMETASDREGGEELNAAGGFGIEVMIVAEGGEVDSGVVEGGWGGGYQMLTVEGMEGEGRCIVEEAFGEAVALKMFGLGV